MQGFYARMCMYVAMEHSYIAISYNPLRIFFKQRKIQRINYPDCSISATGREDSLYLCIIQHGLKIMSSLIVTACKLFIYCINVFAKLNIKSPTLQYFYRRQQFCFRYFASWCHNTHTITLFQK